MLLFLNTTGLKNMRYRILLYIIVLLQPVCAQVSITPFDLPGYSFIRYKSNQFELVQDNPSYDDLFVKFDSLIRTGDNQIKIVHIGGSHIQADVYTHRIRQELQSFYPGFLGSRGFFFPYTVAHTNSPSNLWISYSGVWQTCKNTQAVPTFTLGLSGITSVLTSEAGSLKIVARYDSLRQYDFNRVKVFCNAAETGMIPDVNPGNPQNQVSVHKSGEYVQYDLTNYTDTLTMNIVQNDSTGKSFQLYGISLENDDPGVVYNAIGVNGAKLVSYLRCGLFVQQLKTLDPDWVIVSIGTNEGNTRNFDQDAYRIEYMKLLDSIRLAAPGSAILLTVPNDSYLFKRYINPNTARIREIIFEIARSYKCGVWDFYTIMGGLNSAMTWYNNGLMNKDHIHFNKPGYLLTGDLFYAAFLKSWDDHLSDPQPGLQSLIPVVGYPHTNLQTRIPLILNPASAIGSGGQSQHLIHD
jgi:lysophospholipase L1-like esterase